MKAGRRRVIADIGSHGFLGEQFVETCLIGDLVNEAALIERAEEIGLEPGHNLFLSGISRDLHCISVNGSGFIIVFWKLHRFGHECSLRWTLTRYGVGDSGTAMER